MVREHAMMQHVRVRQNDARHPAYGGPLLLGSVAVVGRVHHFGKQIEVAQFARLILRECLGGKKQQRPRGRIEKQCLEDRRRVAQAFPRSGGSRDHHRKPRPDQIDRFGLMFPQTLDAPCAETGAQRGGQRRIDFGVDGGTGRQKSLVDYLAAVQRMPLQPAQQSVDIQ